MEEAIMQGRTRTELSLDTRPTTVLMLAALSCVLGLITGATAYAGEVTVTTTEVTTTVAQPSVDDPAFWVGRNISAVVKTFGQPTYWNANHDGGGGGARYFYANANQPRFVLETQPGGMIVRAVRLP
jgi:molybdopterin-binding protein